MLEGLPVLVANEISDGVAWIGENLAINGGYEDMVQKILKLYKEDYRKEIKMKLKNRVDGFHTASLIDGLLHITKKAIHIAQEDKENLGNGTGCNVTIHGCE